MNDFQDTPLTPEQLLASSNEALLQAATAGGNLTPQQLALVKASVLNVVNFSLNR